MVPIIVEAVLDMVVDKFAFGASNGLLDCVELLGEINARPAIFDHSDDRPHVAFRTLEALCDLRVGVVPMFCHVCNLSPRGG